MIDNQQNRELSPDIAETLALSLVLEELHKARRKHPTPFHSAHEGAAIIQEEFEEFWDEVKADKPESAQQEVVQLGAMALRYLIEVSAKQTGFTQTAQTETHTDDAQVKIGLYP